MIKGTMDRIFLDTNTIIYLLRNRLPNQMEERIDRADWLGISIINWLEFLSYKEISDRTKERFLDFCNSTAISGIEKENTSLMDAILSIRKRFNLKLPDAIVGASAKINQATLLTADTSFEKLQAEGFLSVEIFSPLSETEES